MPELPEVEVCRQGLLPKLEGRRITAIAIRAPKLRYPIPPDLAVLLPGCVVRAIRRRGKYLLFDCARPGVEGTLIVHLGMSGSLCFVAPGQMPGRHDHVDLRFDQQLLRYTDPRRFGLWLWQAGPPEASGAHPLLAVQGIEPLAPAFDGDWLHTALARRASPVKPVLMDSHLLVGVGNIYASESLFRAGVSPLRPAKRISRARCQRLAAAIRQTLADAIAAGGSSIRDYVHSDGGTGWFQIEAAVYERAGLPCRRCGGLIRQIRQAGRSTYYCPQCQH
ncbi:MAG: bifunctional DNA-formamidopyrimidine glycosylase/DNA-(apurinic or apyrimidinic site) lyase [Azonexus sp.]|jgi:formamidopyrimidine-DNA glycosylase|nr:bifunctional DNA-formamidopyrimidine glycosylase/DNA-(apurinic or apyrimidinic site) lyase [Azonexus sp.]